MENGAALLDAVEKFLCRFVAFPSRHARVAAALWVAHTHAMDAWESTPRLAHLSAEPGSGKTRALETYELLVPSPMHAVNATPAALFRAVADLEPTPTILFDEVDTIFGPKAKENEELRGLLNAGHRRGAVAYRCVGMGTAQKVMPFPAYAAVALAGIGGLPDTILGRSIVIRMRRRAPNEHVEPFRRRDVADEGNALRDRLAAWASGCLDDLTKARPVMPDGVDDRPADVWEPLLAIADAAGAHWPVTARAACAALASPDVTREVSLGIRLLADIREAFTLRDEDGQIIGTRERLSTDDLLTILNGMPEAPWGNLRGAPLDERRLAKMLRPYEARPHQFKVGSDKVRGYSQAGDGKGAGGLFDAFDRYLPTFGDLDGTTGTRGTAQVNAPPEQGDNQLGTGTTPASGTDTMSLTSGAPEVPVVPPIQEDLTEPLERRLQLVREASADPMDGTCSACKKPLIDVDGRGTHPGCDPTVKAKAAPTPRDLFAVRGGRSW